MALRPAVDQHPIELEFVVDELRQGKAPLIGYLDVFENVDAAGITGLFFCSGRLGGIPCLLSFDATRL